MTTIRCKENQLWSANPIEAMKAFYDCQTRQVYSEKKDFENDFTDDRHWTTDLNDQREAFYEYTEQVKMSKSVFTPLKKHMQKSLYADLEKTIERLKKRLRHFISDTQLNELLDSISRGLCYGNCNINNKKLSYECCNTFENFNESLLNDQCNIINGLVNCLKMYMDEDEIFKLLDVKSSDQDKKNYIEYIFTSMKKIFGFISFSSGQKIFQNKPIDFCACSQADSNSNEDFTVNKSENQPICKCQTDSNSKGDFTVNKCENRPICKPQTDINLKDDLTVNKLKKQPICEVDDVDCCEDNIKLKNALAEMEIIKNNLLREKQLKEVAGCQLLLNIRKASLNIKRENILSYYL